MQKITFGTDGWRGLIGRDFTFDNVACVIQAYANVLGVSKADKTKPIPIGYDRRFLSKEFAGEAAAILASNGFKVKLAESFCPTPAISCLTKAEGALGGVVITASHNPYPWNGIKFKEGYGGSASPEFTTQVEKRIQALGSVIPRSRPLEDFIKSGHVIPFDPRPDYLRALKNQVDIPKILHAKWKIGYDSLFGAGSGYLTQVFDLPNQPQRGVEGEAPRALPVEGATRAPMIVELHHEENPCFGGLNPEPIEANLGQLIQRVKTKHLDVGPATDGDADRIGAVDEQGHFVTSQQIFALLLDHLVAKGLRGAVVKTVSTTQMVNRIAERHGLQVYETPIGFKYICEKFLATTPLIGGEESGGIGIPSHVYERDGLLAALLLLEMMTERKKRLGELLHDLTEKIGPFHFARRDCHLKPEEIQRVRERLHENSFANQSSVAGLAVERSDRTDGVKFYLSGNAWLLLRASGTEPLVRLYAEAPTTGLVQQILEAGQQLLWG